MNTIVQGAKSGSSSSRTAKVQDDSAASNTYARIVYGLSEGEIEGVANGLQSIYLDDTPIQSANGTNNFEDVSLDWRTGTNDQTFMPGFTDVSNETGINVELKTSWSRAFSNTEIDAITVRLMWGALRTTDSKTGDVTGVTIKYAIDLSTDGGSYQTVLDTQISDKTSSNYARTHKIVLPPASSGWTIRVRRITPPAESDYVSDTMYVDAVAEIIDAKFAYPNTAVLGLQYNAESFSSIAKIAVEAKGIKILVPSNYDPVTRTYTGIWNGSFKRAYSNNPAWVYYNLCTATRYGLGKRITAAMLDKASLYRLGQYCDEMVSDGVGGLEPRFTCNVYIQSAEDAYAILGKLAGVFRAISYWDGDSIICDADIPQDTYFAYSRANVIDGLLEYSGTRARDRHNVAKVAWDNPQNRYKTEYEMVRDEAAIAKSGSVNILEIEAWGCTSRGQAQRAGLWALKSEQLETRSVTFKVGLDGNIPLPGKIIEVSDNLFTGRANGGRVSAISVDKKTITLDREATANAGDMLVINSESGQSESRSITQVSGKQVTVNLAFNNIAAQNVWVIDAADLATMKFRVTSITQDDKHQFTITALQYNEQKYAAIDDGAYVDPTPISIINPKTQDPVTDVTISTYDQVQQGLSLATMVISWNKANLAVKYLVEWKKDDGSWVKLPLTGNTSVEIIGVYSGDYIARVTAISAFDISSLPASSVLTTLNGKTGTPPKLASITATGILFGMVVDWAFPAVGALDTAYTEIEVSSDGGNTLNKLGLFAYPTNTTTIQGLQGNLRQYYRGRLIDRIGNVGEWSDWTSGVTSADADLVLDLLTDQITSSQLDQDLRTSIAEGENASAAAQIAKEAADNAQATANDAQATADIAATLANDAKASAAQAQATATTLGNEAKAAAATAQQTANTAKATADDASNLANATANDLADYAASNAIDISDLNAGITKEITDRKNADTQITGELTAYKSSNDSALAVVATKAQSAVDASSSNASNIITLTSTVNTKNRTYRQTTAPTAGLVVGDLWINTTSGQNNETRRWNGSAWDVITDPRTATNASATSALTTRVTTAEGNISAQSTRIDNLTAVVDDKASGAALSALTIEVTNVKGTVTSQGNDITSLKNTVNNPTTGLAATATGLNALTTKVNDSSTGLDSKASSASVTTLTATVNTKNRTYRQAAAPTANLVVGDLWVNTTSGANNEMKRWDGTSWDTTIDPRTAANATAITTTNATVTAIDGRVTTNANNIASLTTVVDGKASNSAIAGLQSQITDIDGRVTSTNNNVVALTGRVTDVESKTTANATAISNTYTKTETDTVVAGAVNSFAGSINVGSKNLLLNTARLTASEKYKGYGVTSVTLTTTGSYDFWAQSVEAPVDGTEYVLSFYARATEEATLRSYFYSPNTTTGMTNSQGKTGTGSDGNSEFTLSTEWVRYWVKWKQTATTGSKALIAGRAYGQAGKTIKFDMAMVQLEEGNIPTSYSPSAKETQQSLDANASAITATNAEVTNVKGTVTSNSSDITTLKNNVTTINGTLSTKTDNTVTSALTGRVTTAENNITSQGSLITSLRSDVTTVTNTVNTKNRTYRQTTAPTANLVVGDGWVNTTSGQNNKLSIWSGSAWVDASDPRVATLVTQVATKADSSALQTLDNKVTGIDGRVTSNTNATTALTGRVSSAESNIASNASAIANTYTKNQTDSAISGAISTFDAGLVLGGTNYLLNTVAPTAAKPVVPYGIGGYGSQKLTVSYVSTETFYTVNAVDGERYVRFCQSLNSLGDLQAGKTYTFSFDIRGQAGAQCRIITYANGGWSDILKETCTYTNNTHVRNSFTFTIPSSATGIVLSIQTEREVGSAFTIKNKSMQLELGNKASDWSESPYDVDGKITTVQANLTNFQQAQATTDQAQTTRLNTAESNISNNTSAITNIQSTKANKTEVASIAQTALQATWKADATTEANTAVNNLTIGGRNLIQNSDFIDGTSNKWGRNGGTFEFGTDGGRKFCMFTGTTNNGIYQTATQGFAIGDPITISLWVKDNTAPLRVGVPSGPYASFDVPAGNTEWTRYVTTGTKSSTGSTLTVYLNGSGTAKVANIQVEKASKASDWSPAPEDAVTALAALSSTVATTYETKSDAASTKASLTNTLNSKASQSALDNTNAAVGTKANQADLNATNANLTTNYYTKAATDTSQANMVSSLTASINSLPVGGTNLIGNSDFSLGNTNYWGGATGTETATFTVLPDSSQWSVGGNAQSSKTAQVYAVGTNASNLYSEAVTDCSVVGGNTYQLSAYIGNHRCEVRLFCYWYAADGSSLGNTYLQQASTSTITAANAKSGGNTLQGYARLYQNVTAPAGAVKCRITLRKMGGTDAYMFFTRAQVCEVNSLSASVVPWSESTASIAYSTAANASALQATNTNVSTIDGKVTAQASQLTNLTTTVGNNTASISSQQTSINGLNAKATLQVAAGNTIGGVALGNNAGVVDFIVRANTFAVAPPVSAGAGNTGKYAFTYKSTSSTLPNGTVIPAGLYLDQAFIDRIDANKINVNELMSQNISFTGTITGGNTSGGGIIKSYDGRMVINLVNGSIYIQ